MWGVSEYKYFEVPASNILLLPINGDYDRSLWGALWGGGSVNVFYLSFRTSEAPTRFKTISALPLGEPNIDTACRTKSPLAGVAMRVCQK